MTWHAPLPMHTWGGLGRPSACPPCPPTVDSTTQAHPCRTGSTPAAPGRRPACWRALGPSPRRTPAQRRCLVGPQPARGVEGTAGNCRGGPTTQRWQPAAALPAALPPARLPQHAFDVALQLMLLLPMSRASALSLPCPAPTLPGASSGSSLALCSASVAARQGPYPANTTRWRTQPRSCATEAPRA